MGLKWDCPANQTCSTWALSYFWDCICGPSDLISFCLGIVSIICWAVAELPQTFQSCESVIADGTSLTLILTWMMGDVFNFFGCLTTPGTLPTQLYLATLFCATTFPLVVQHIRYAWISYRNSLRPPRGDPLWPNLRISRLRDDGRSEADLLLTALPGSQSLPAKQKSQEISVQREAFSLPARPHMRDMNPHSASVPVQPTLLSPTRFSDSWRRLTSHSSGGTSSPAAVRGILDWNDLLPMPLQLIFSALVIVTVSGISSFSLARDSKRSSGISWSEVEAGRSLQEVEGNGLMQSLGLVLGILMACTYLTGRLPQCMVNCSHDFEIGVSVSTMVFTFLGNVTYLGSILARGVWWNRLQPILPWVFDVSCCLFMDLSIRKLVFYLGGHEAKSLKKEKFTLRIYPLYMSCCLTAPTLVKMVFQYLIRHRRDGYESLA